MMTQKDDDDNDDKQRLTASCEYTVDIYTLSVVDVCVRRVLLSCDSTCAFVPASHVPHGGPLFQRCRLQVPHRLVSQRETPSSTFPSQLHTHTHIYIYTQAVFLCYFSPHPVRVHTSTFLCVHIYFLLLVRVCFPHLYFPQYFHVPT